jgi:hypothetical protein
MTPSILEILHQFGRENKQRVDVHQKHAPPRWRVFVVKYDLLIRRLNIISSDGTIRLSKIAHVARLVLCGLYAELGTGCMRWSELVSLTCDVIAEMPFDLISD